ncbi:MAG TPA: PQQ-binding-like beta-propeller repeat protein, partial [Anaerolineae bacterium]|nr:PQQ-binding-like beta-propeller repeat protein [Anaerolineae bacterium]
GQFSSPRGLALDEQGNLYVADTGNQRIQVFDPRGVYLMSIADSRFEGPRYVEVDDLGRIYVSDASDRVHLFDARGEPLQSFGQPGSLPSQFSQIADLVVDAAGELYVVDSGNARVQKFSLLRGLLFAFGDTGGETELLSRPQGIAVDAVGNVYVGDAGSGRILKYVPGGTFLSVLATEIGELREIDIDEQGYLYAADGAESVVRMIDPQGRTVMRLGEGQLSDPWGVAVDKGGRVYVSDAGHHRILVLEVPGEVPTPVSLPSPVASPTATLVPMEGSSPWPMYGGNPQHTGYAQAQGPAQPNLRWMYRAGLLASSPVIGADGSLYFGSLDGNVYALDPDGAELWRSPLGQVSGMPALSPEGLVYVGVASPVEEMFYALEREGSVAWSYHLEGHIVESSPVVAPDGTVYLSASNPQTAGGSVVALSPDGGERWRYEVGSRLPFSPTLGPDGTVYVGARNGDLYALSPDGSLHWQASLGEISSSAAVGADGTIHIGTGSGYQALNPSDGSQTWAFSPVGGEADSTPALGPEGRVYVTSTSNKLYALNQNGTAAWIFTAEAEEGKEIQFSSPATIDAAGVLYVGTREGELFAINPDGTLRWRLFLPEGGMVLVGPAIGGDGTLYVGAGSNVYAVGQ